MQFKEKLENLITLLENWLSEPEDQVQLEQWDESAAILSYSFEFSDVEEDYVDQIIEMYISQFKIKMEEEIMSDETASIPVELLDRLIASKQTTQRTPEWYLQMSSIISASELGSLFASDRQRAKLVMSKTVPYQRPIQPLTAFSERMSAFDWGIRFEPVVKQIYIHKYNVTLQELGRLHHADDPRCTASPDGLVYQCPKNERTGRLIEIKCPVTREINGKIPKDYYSQMQMQLHVTGLKKCDYIEAEFASKYNNHEMKPGPGLYEGKIAIVRYAEITEGQEFYYEYSPVNCEVTWIPDVKDDEEIVEITDWRLFQWSEQVVVRSEEWWQSLQPMIQTFWDDVEKAKRGEFEVPESSRPAKKPKVEKCMIVITKLE
jgi:hypothetical protein